MPATTDLAAANHGEIGGHRSQILFVRRESRIQKRSGRAFAMELRETHGKRRGGMTSIDLRCDQSRPVHQCRSSCQTAGRPSA